MSQMNKSFLKFVTDFGPLAIFFFYYYNNDKNLSIGNTSTYSCNLIALIIVWFFEKKIPMMPLNKWHINYFIWWSYNLF